MLDQYRDAAVAVVGCHSAGIARPCCELDVLVVSDEPRPPASLRLGGALLDVFFVAHREVLSPQDPEVGLALARARAVRDSGMTVSTGAATGAAVFEANCKKALQARLSSAVKALGRADESLGMKALRDADFWLLKASYDLAFGWLYSRQVVPAPSHLLSQLRAESAHSPLRFGAFSKGAGLERGSKKACSVRSDALGILYDSLGSRTDSPRRTAQWTEFSYAIVKGKAEYLSSSFEHAECYCFLGLEAVAALEQLTVTQQQGKRGSDPNVITGMAERGERMVGESLARELGLSRGQRTVESGVRAVKEQVSALAREK